MDKLVVSRKKKLGGFILSCFVVFCIIYIYPICLYSVCELVFNDNGVFSSGRNFLDDLIVVVFALPGSIPWCIRIKEYICILLDIKSRKLMTCKVKGCGKPTVEFLDTLASRNQNDMYYYWKAKDNLNKKYKFMIFKDVSGLKGKTIKHSYNVTYYKYSKIVTSIEKTDRKTGDS